MSWYNPIDDVKQAAGYVKGKVEDVGSYVKDKLYGNSLDPVSTAALADDKARAIEMYQKFGNQGPQPTVGPMNATQEANAPTIQAVNADAAQRATVSTAQGADPVKFQLGNNVERVMSRDVAAPNIGPAAGAQAAPNAIASQINTGKSDQDRAQMMGLTQSYQDVLSGRAPSVAENQMKIGMAQAANTGLGIAAQARGTQRGAARIEAMRNIGDQQAASINQAAMLRAHEMDQARSGESGLLGNIRGTDSSEATTQAQLGTNVSLANMGETGTTNRFNTGQQNAMTQFGAQLGTDVATGNANRDLAGQSTNAAAQNQRINAVAEGNLAADTGNATRTQQNQQFNAGQQQSGSEFNAGATNAFTQADAARKQEANTQNVANTIGVGTRNTTRQQDAATNNLNTGITQRGQNIIQQSGLNADQLSASGQATGTDKTAIDADTANKARRAQVGNSLLDTGTKIASGLLTKSDKRAKEDIEPAHYAGSASKASSFVEALADKARTWRYKDDPEGHKMSGVVAQDIERVPGAKQFVGERPDGMKGVDYAGLTAALLAAVEKSRKEAR